MIWTSRYEPVEVGAITFHELVAGTVARHPDRVALVDAVTGAELSYAALAKRADRVAAMLAARGFAPGDVLALRAPNVPAWAGIAVGATAAGGAVTGVGAGCTAPELERRLADSGAAMLIDGPDIGPGLISATGPAPAPAVGPRRPGAAAVLERHERACGSPRTTSWSRSHRSRT